MRRWFEIWIMLVAFLARAGQPAENLSLEGVKQFEVAYQAWNGTQFAAAAELFRQATTYAPPSSINFYWLCTCQFHTADKPSKQREALATFLQAEKLLEAEAKTPASPLEPR